MNEEANKPLGIMTAKELLLLQTEQMQLLIEQTELKRKVLYIESKLGLNNSVWATKQHTMCDAKIFIFRGLIEDYHICLNKIAAHEQEEAELLKAAHIECKELDKAIEDNTVDNIFTGDDDHAKEVEEDEHFIVHPPKENVLKDESS